MSGGGKSISKGRMGGKIMQDIGPKDVEKIEKDTEVLIGQLQVCLLYLGSSSCSFGWKEDCCSSARLNTTLLICRSSFFAKMHASPLFCWHT